MLYGVTDPVAFLAQHPHDWAVAVAVVKKAQELDVKRRETELRVLADAVGAKVAEQVGKTMSALLTQVFR